MVRECSILSASFLRVDPGLRSTKSWEEEGSGNKIQNKGLTLESWGEGLGEFGGSENIRVVRFIACV